MIQGELYINDQLIELSPESLVALSFAIADIATPADRNADFSNVFKAPMSGANKAALEFAYLIGSPTSLPYKINTARIVQGGVTTLPNGIAQITAVEGKYFSIKVISGNGTFFKSLGTKKLAELDLSALDYPFDFLTIFNSWTNTVSDGFKYPLINYGRFDTSRTVDARQLRPATYAKVVIEKILSEQGYTGQGDILNSYELDHLLVPFTNSKFVGAPAYTIARGNNALDQVVPDASIPGNNRKFFYIDNSGPSDDPNNLITNGLYPGGGYYTAAYNGFHKCRWVFPYENLSGGLASIEVYINRGGTIYLIGSDNFAEADFYAGAINGTFNYEFIAPLITGDKLFVVISNNGIGNLTLKNGSYFEVYDAYDIEVTYGTGVVSIARNLPDWTCVEFLKLIAQLYGIIFVTDTVMKIVYFHQFKKLYDNKPRAKNWTNKIDMRSRKVEYKVGSYAQKNVLKYKEDKNDKEFILNSADGSLTVADENLATKKDLFSLIVAGTYETSQYLGGLQAPIIRKIKALPDPDDSFSVSTEPRLLYDFVMPGEPDGSGPLAVPITLTDGTTTVTQDTQIPLPYFATIPPALTLSFGPIGRSLAWQNLLIYYYKELSLMLDKAKVLQVEAEITPQDIAELDQLTPIYLDQEAAYFYLNLLDKFVNDGRKSSLELIRL